MDLFEGKGGTPTSVGLAEGCEEVSADSERKLQKFATMLNKAHPGNRIGYRFLEYEPLIFGTVPEEFEDREITAEAGRLEREFASKHGVFVNRIDLEGSKGWGKQVWTFYIVPVADGIEMLWVVETKEAGLNNIYIAQQCFRMSGKTNEEWRHPIAETEAFSEYDLWLQQEKEGAGRTSLSFVRRSNRWESIPPVDEQIIFRTPDGLAIDLRRSGGDLKKIGEMKPSFNPEGKLIFEADIDNGLMTRTDVEGRWVSALYWERTTHISNHHPADCLHSFVNIGPLAPHSKRAIRGRIYWARISKEELYEKWQRDRPH